MNEKIQNRCEWAGTKDPFYIAYHDNEWGVVAHDDIRLFEAIVLDAFQAGLSWAIILKKRENFRAAFDNFDPEVIANYDDKKIAALLYDAGIVRNKLKINSAIINAKAFLSVKEEFGSFDKYIWQFTDHQIKVNRWKSMSEIPASTPESDAMSKDLKGRGFKFVGSTICYAFMQAVGMVNDHTVDCFRYNQLQSS